MQQHNNGNTISRYRMICNAIAIGLGLDAVAVSGEMVHFIGSDAGALELKETYAKAGIKTQLQARRNGMSEVLISFTDLEIALAFR